MVRSLVQYQRPNQPPWSPENRFFLSSRFLCRGRCSKLSCLEQDAQKAADLLKDRVEFAAKRVVASMCDAVVRFRDALDKSKAKQTLAMGQAVTLEEAEVAASSAVKLTRNEAIAAKLRLEHSSRTHRVLNYFKAKWDNEPRPLDVDEAERRLDEAVRGVTSANKEAELAWNVVHKNFNQVEALACKLRRAQYAQASAKTILVDLEAELTRAKHQVVRTAREFALVGAWLGKSTCRGREEGWARCS